MQDVGNRETDRKDVLEWLAEWGRDVRKRQTGLILLSAHRAKGLEFDHVVVLDGAWEKRSKGEDRDAARRLLYVAMTRARHSLALMAMANTHPILGGPNDHAFLIGGQRQGAIDVSECRKVYQTLDPSEVDLGFAGRLAPGHASLRAIDHLKPDDMLLLAQRGESWVVTNTAGVPVCRLAKKYRPPEGRKFLRGSVHAITARFREDSSEDYHAQLKRDAWNVVLPELVFEPMS